MPLTPAERRANARYAALTRSATTDGSEISRPAREALLARDYPDDPNLNPEERERRARANRRARMAKLGQLSGKARRAARAAAEAAAELEDAVDQALADEAL